MLLLDAEVLISGLMLIGSHASHDDVGIDLCAGGDYLRDQPSEIAPIVRG